MISNSLIGILGCGWLGKATAKALIDKGYKVRGSTTRLENVQELKDIGIEPFVIDLKPQHPISNLEVFLSGLKVIIIAIPPKIKQNGNQLLESLELLFAEHDLSGAEKLIYISSTGVFKEGRDANYDEDSQPNNNSQRGEYLTALENVILNQKQIENCKVLRYGGLVKHGGRHPIYYLSGKKDIQNPNAPINLIEQSDAVNLLCEIIENSSPRKMYHGVYPFYPKRKEYYVSKAKALHLEPPEFFEDKKSLGKQISSEKTQMDLNFRFEYKI